jgi:hypothetical protein
MHVDLVLFLVVFVFLVAMFAGIMLACRKFQRGGIPVPGQCQLHYAPGAPAGWSHGMHTQLWLGAPLGKFAAESVAWGREKLSPPIE